MLTRVFVLFAFMAMAVQAASLLSPEQAMMADKFHSTERNLLQAGSGQSTGVTDFQVESLAGGELTVSFIGNANTFYYVMVRSAGGFVPSSVDIVDGTPSHLDLVNDYTSVTYDPATERVTFVITDLSEDSVDIFLAGKNDGVVYPNDLLATGETIALAFPVTTDLAVTATAAQDGAYAVTASATGSGSYIAFVDFCCGAVGFPACSVDALGATVCADPADLTSFEYYTLATPTTFDGSVVYGTSDVVFEAGKKYAAYFYFFSDNGVDTATSTLLAVVDNTAPVWVAAPAVASVDGSSVTFTVAADDEVVYYSVALTATDVAPTAAEIIAAGNVGTSVTGLADNTDYVVYVVAHSAVSGDSVVASFPATTADMTPPVTSEFSATTVTRDSAVVTFTADEPVTLLAILNADGTAATTSDFNVAASNFVDISSGALTGMTADTTYALTVIAMDAAGNYGPIETITFTTAPLYVFNTELYVITDDTTISSDGLVRGADTTLVVSATSSVLVQTGMPISQDGVGPASATVTFYGGVEGAVYTLSTMQTAWTELGATATCAASIVQTCINADWDILNNDGSYTGAITGTVVDGILVFDVTADVSAFIGGSQDNFGWYLSGPDGTFSSSEGANGPEVTMLYHADVTTGSQAFLACETLVLDLSCASGVISIMSARYGRQNTDQCPTSPFLMRNADCTAPDSVSVLSDACNGKTSCSFDVVTTNFAADPCAQTYKYLEGTYVCAASAGDFCSGFVASAAQTACVSSSVGPVYTCGATFSGNDCSIETPVTCEPLVAHYSFDAESSVDDSCNNNDATDTNSPLYVNGVSGSAAHYGSADNQYAHAADSADLGLSTGFSACLWVNADTVSNGHTSVLLSQGVMGGAVQGRQGFGIYLNKDNKYGTGARAAVRFERDHGRQTLEQAFTIDGSWHFICAVFSEDVQSFYVDATVVTESRFANHGPVTASTQGLFIGSDYEGSKYQFTGAIDEVRVFNSALTQAEVSEVFTGDGGLLPNTGFFTADDTIADEDDVDHVVLSVSDTGCAAGEAQGFLGQKSISACAGAWSVAGVATEASYSRQCDSNGDADGQGCSVADVCAVGWHVCESATEVLDASDNLGCNGVSDFSDGFFVTRQSGPGSIIMSEDGTNDVFGCGQGAGVKSDNEKRGLNAFTHNKCSQVDGSWSCPGSGYDEALTIVHNTNVGGALCCRDNREQNCGMQNSGKKQVEVRVKKNTGESHTDDEKAKEIGDAIESEVCKKSGKSCKVECVRKRSGSSNDSHKSKSKKGGKRRLLQVADPQYTYVVYEVTPGVTSDGNEVADINAVIVSSDSAVSTNYNVEAFNELHSCADGTMRASCSGVTMRETVSLPAGAVGDGYGAENKSVGNTNDIVNAVIVTAAVFVLFIAVAFAYRAKTAKHVDAEFDSRIMNSNVAASDVEMSAVKGGEQDTYWVFNKKNEGQENVRVVV